MPEGSCDPMGTPHWRRLLAGPVAPWREEPRPGSFAVRTSDLTEDPHWKGLLLKGCIAWKGPLEQGNSVRSALPEEEGVTETAYGEPTAVLTPCPPEVLGNGGRE